MGAVGSAGAAVVAGCPINCITPAFKVGYSGFCLCIARIAGIKLTYDNLVISNRQHPHVNVAGRVNIRW